MPDENRLLLGTVVVPEKSRGRWRQIKMKEASVRLELQTYIQAPNRKKNIHTSKQKGKRWGGTIVTRRRKQTKRERGCLQQQLLASNGGMQRRGLENKKQKKKWCPLICWRARLRQTEMQKQKLRGGKQRQHETDKKSGGNWFRPSTRLDTSRSRIQSI